MTEMRRHHERRKGEANGRICWISFFVGILNMIMICLMVLVGFWAGSHYEKTKDTLTLKAVPTTEFRRGK